MYNSPRTPKNPIHNRPRKKISLALPTSSLLSQDHRFPHLRFLVRIGKKSNRPNQAVLSPSRMKSGFEGTGNGEFTTHHHYQSLPTYELVPLLWYYCMYCTVCTRQSTNSTSCAWMVRSGRYLFLRLRVHGFIEAWKSKCTMYVVVIP